MSFEILGDSDAAVCVDGVCELPAPHPAVKPDAEQDQPAASESASPSPRSTPAA